MINIEPVNRDATRDLILQMKGGILTDADYQALDACTAFASHLWVGHIRGAPCFAYGLVPPTLLSDHAYLWLYSTDAVEEYKFLFVRHSQLVITELLKVYPVIYGVCDITQPKSIRWIKWLGGKFGAPGKTHISFVIEASNG